MKQVAYFETASRLDGVHVVDYRADGAVYRYTLRFVPKRDPDSMFYLETARGDLREFRSLDTLFMYVRGFDVTNVQIMPGPGFFELQQ